MHPIRHNRRKHLLANEGVESPV